MTLSQITLDPPVLKVALSIVGGVLLIAMVRILFLLCTHKRLREATQKMEKQLLAQHNQLLFVKQDSNAWRGEIQRMLDAFRAEYAKRLEESEQRHQQIQQLAAEPVTASKPPPSPPAACIIAAVKEDSVGPLPALTIS
jgi:hypothetical protein